MNGWVDKEDVVYIFRGKLHSHKNKMSGSIGCYAKWNKSDGERQILYTLMYMCNLKNKHKNENRLRLREQRVVARMEGGGRNILVYVLPKRAYGGRK